MTYLLSLRKEAEFDISEAFDYYQDIRSGLGHDFLLCVEEAFNKIRAGFKNLLQSYISFNKKRFVGRTIII